MEGGQCVEISQVKEYDVSVVNRGVVSVARPVGSYSSWIPFLFRQKSAPLLRV